jgi:HEPN domain-containing protein
VLALADRSADWVDQSLRDLEQAEQSMQAVRHQWACFAAHQAVEKALKGLNLALGQQAWGHTLTRLWTVLPQQDWQPAPPEGLEGSGALNPVLTPSAEPSGPFRQLHQPALEGLQIGQYLGQQIQHQSQPPLHMLGIEIVGIKLAHPMMKAQPFAQPTRGSGADQRRVMARGAPGSLVGGCTICTIFTNQGELWEKSRSARPARTSLR